MNKTLKILMLVFIIFVAIFPISDFFSDFYKTFERKTYDLRETISAREERIPEIVIVDIDNETLKELGRFQSWPRYNIAKVINVISRQSPKIIGIDFLFSEPDTVTLAIKNIFRTFLMDKIPNNVSIDTLLSYFSFDKYLASSIKYNGKVVLASVLTPDSTFMPIPALDRFYLSIPIDFNTEAYRGIFYPIPQFLDVILSTGAINLFPDPDGVIRSAPLYYNLNGRAFPNFSFAIFSKLKKNIHIEGNYLIQGDKKIRLYNNRIFIDFKYPLTTFPYVSFSDVFFERIPDDIFKDKIVFIGTSAPALSDLFKIPIKTATMPGVELNANILYNLLQGKSIKITNTYTTNYIIGFLLIFLILFIAFKLPTAGSIPLLIAILLGYYLFAMRLYSTKLVMIEMVRPMFAIVVGYIFGIGYRVNVIETERRKIRALFSKYVPKEIVEKILQSKHLEVKGERRKISVLFCDIRDFTGFAESRDPEIVVTEMNKYYEEMSKIIFKHNGMIDKFIGDGIMAIFGAPLSYTGHADKAVSAAVEMVKKAKEISKEWERKKGRSFEVGIGINSGVAIVGNVGSSIRTEYTAVGDTVNIASRLEPMNKEFKTSILITENTRRELSGDYHLRNLGNTLLRGKKKEITLFEVMPF